MVEVLVVVLTWESVGLWVAFFLVVVMLMVVTMLAI